MRPALKWRMREFDSATLSQLVDIGMNELNARLIANRVNDPKVALAMISPSLSNLASPYLMKDMDKAVLRIVRALRNREVIGLETDHDCDGQTSHAILYLGLTEIFGHPKDRVRSYIGHRMEEGYGLSDALVDRIITDEPNPSLVITADNGSTDESRIERLKFHDIDTIVTDHHAIPPEGIPKSAIAVLNPTRSDCDFPDPYIAGCMVSWLLLAAVRRYHIDHGIALKNEIGLVDLLDFVAIGTVADCVSMSKSIINRVVTHFGLNLIRQRKRPCWRIFDEGVIDSSFLGFTIGPLLNADGRLSDALGSVSFLLEQNHQALCQMYAQLKEQNQVRKQIQKRITDQAYVLAQECYHRGCKTICVYLEDGHAGVHGISASRIKDIFGLPTIIFSPKQGDEAIITGSARSIDGLDLKAVLDCIYASDPTMFVKYGGHSGAAGLTIPKCRFADFVVAFEKAVADKFQLAPELIGPYIDVDMELTAQDLSLENYDNIAQLEPFGRQFEMPVFYSAAYIERIKFVGKGQAHAQIWLEMDGQSFKGIWFFANEIEIAGKLVSGDKVNVCYALQKETFRGEASLGLNIKHIEYVC